MPTPPPPKPQDPNAPHPPPPPPKGDVPPHILHEIMDLKEKVGILEGKIEVLLRMIPQQNKAM